MGAKRLDRRVSDRFKLPDDAQREGRVGRGHPIAHIHKAEIYDVSYAGIAFRIASDISPQIGEVVAVEFTLPKYSKMAWYAQVMRVEIDHALSSTDLTVIKAGAKFLELPHSRRKLLEGHIDDLLQEVSVNQSQRVSILTNALRVQRSYESSFLKLLRGFIVFVACLILASWFINHLSEIGSSELRTNRPPIWPGYKENAPNVNPWRESERAPANSPKSLPE